MGIPARTFGITHQRNFAISLLKIVNHHFPAGAFKNTVHKFHVLGVKLIFVLRFFIGENQVKRDLITLIHDGPMTANHFAGVKLDNARNRFEQRIDAFEQFVRGFWICRVGPENNNV